MCKKRKNMNERKDRIQYPKDGLKPKEEDDFLNS